MIQSCAITGNRAFESGGGIDCRNNSNPTITNNAISQNNAIYGGGIDCHANSAPSIAGNDITGNNVSSGGGVYCNSSSPAINNNRIAGNTASSNGGGIYCYNNSLPAIGNNRINANSASSGGGIYCADASPSIANNTISGNSAASGGGIDCSSSSPAIRNNSIIGNGATTGGGMYCRATSSPILANNIIAFNQSGITKETGSGAPVLRHNAAYNPGGNNYTNIAPGAGDINLDPKLEAPAYGRYHLNSDSPCIDAGNDADVETGWLDMDEQPRISGSHVDVGADEYDTTAYPFTPAVIRVRPSGSDDNDGSTWTLAKQSVQAGIDAASAAGGEVWVAEGTYYERITLKPFVNLYGGFAGSETERTLRNFKAHPTIMDGRQEGTVVTVNYSGYLLNRIDGLTIRNGQGGILCSYSSPAIANNTICGNSGASGNGILCSYASPVICNNVIVGNGAPRGGGIYCYYSSSPSILNNTVIANTARFGGGIYSHFTSAPILANNLIAFNQSGIFHEAGSTTPVLRNNAVYNPGGDNYTNIAPGTNDINLDPKLEAPEYGKYHLKSDSPCINTGNDADVQAGEVDMDGQTRIVGSHMDIGADEYDTTAYPFTPAIIRVRPSGNDDNNGSNWTLAKQSVQAGIDAASAVGGEVWVAEGTYNERITLKAFVYLYGGFAGSETERSQRNTQTHPALLDGQANGTVVTAANCGYRISRIDGLTVRNGTGTTLGKSTGGGGILCSYASPIIARNTIRQNNASNGGGIYCYSAFPIIAGNVICQNIATNGGGIYCGQCLPSITNNTICENTDSAGGGGILCDWLDAPITIANNIIAFNNSGILRTGRITPVLRNNCVYNPDGDNYTNCSAGTGDIQMDPLFVDRPAGNYHLLSTSPCRNAGNDTDVQPGGLDIDGQARNNETHVDIGADEYYAPAGYNITGQVTLQYRSDQSQVEVTVALRKNGQTVRTEILDLDTQGHYTIANVAPGNYSLLFSAQKFLKKALPVQIVDQDRSGQNVTLPVGDYDGDNEVTVFDINMILLAFGGIEGDPGWDPAADLDGDGEITVFDVNIVLLNFGMMGDE